MKLWAIFIFIMATFTAANETLKLNPTENELWKNATIATMKLDYTTAMEYAKKLQSTNEGVGCVLKNVVRISLYDDKGDTTALLDAGKFLENCKTEGLWDALRRFELGYIQGETGHSVKGAMTTRSAAKAFNESDELEAKAFYAIYAYYVDKSFSWVPFKSDNRELYLATLDSASLFSERFSPLFLTPLIWMYYDKEDFNTGLKLAERGLKKYPHHPVLLQIKADMLYRLKRHKEAAAIYKKSAEDYLNRTGESIRYWCAALNLVRIYNDMGDKSRKDFWKQKLQSENFNKIRHWMPSSLISDIEKRNLLKD